ncbi:MULTISPECIES: hypothetical protein [unclassified Streptomyces]|uniref:hypothetical protein n=1 Tax=unclassified Streptomyces TaxID=2593676 RepID=UPI00093FA308|nr:hypothetical protein [Streptomyces sp. CB02058]OKI93612.1 hypothetical protein AMK10_14430 [Streptomyces sp. CB02058]
MSAYHVVGLLGGAAVLACLVVLEEIVRKGIKEAAKRVPVPTCGSCGHLIALHSDRGCSHSYLNYHWDTDLDYTRKYNYHRVSCSCAATGPAER